MPEPTPQAKDRVIIGLGVFITVFSLIGAFALGDYSKQPEGTPTTTPDPFAGFKDTSVKAGDIAGQSTEGSAGTSKTVTIGDANVFHVVVDLTWTDEPDTARHTNQPDSFKLEVTSPNGNTSEGSGTNVHGSPGTLEVVLDRNITKEVLANKALKKKTADPTWTGDWGINVTCTSAGDQVPSIGPDPIHVRDQVDTGNAWSLSVNWTFKSK